MHVLRVFRMPKQRFQEGDSPVLGTFFGSPGANFLVSTWVERPHCTLPPSQKAWKFLPETVRSFQARFVPDTIGQERTRESCGLAHAPVFSLCPPPQLSSRGRCLRRCVMH